MHLSSFTILFPVLLGAVFFRSLTIPIKILYGFILFCFFVEIWAIILFLKGENNLFLYHYYTLFEFSFLSLIYYRLFDKLFNKILVSVVSIGFVCFLINSILKIAEFNLLDSYNRLIEASILLVYFVLYLIRIMKGSKYFFLERHPYFILTFSFILYFLGTTFLFFFSNKLEGNAYLSGWAVHSLLNIFLNISYTVVIWKTNKSLNI